MKIYKVDKTLVSTNRIAMMEHKPLLVVREKDGGTPQVAVDPVGCKPGDWVICCGSSAARDATGVKGYPSDLTIVGIIDKWEVPQDADTTS
ncbi:MAG: carboxysome peptide A [Hydrogenovibrio crunogenus]|uniref:Carboxysome shell vertex protein CsoS4A n=1 Tax=Hydrogenovibrio crunogenus (strain DSM 25203 / XCL-2) TaxID=317025 RepID=CSS4A_HYDCU|nr:RecName: Full=Carboxysome shell vertex protein CsoS4A [Hydrogenovibrio crunogenus XCL-2]MBD3611233.1 carboxysome peptide A [Hydrogenovibrio crunogenus]